MSERKVLNKYYPPDFDPTKIPKLRLPKNRTFNIRLMAPFNMRCNTCGEYIYKGKKFNSRKETVEYETYLGLHIYRFYIKCPRCIAEISFKTDPKNTDYELEAGATRNFEALRTAEKLALKEQQEKDDEEANNPMKLLENRTKASQREMDTLEMLEDLKEMRRKQETVNTEELLTSYRTKYQKTEEELLEEESKALQDEFRFRNHGEMKRILDCSKGDKEPPSKVSKSVDLSLSTQFPKFKRPLTSYSKQFDKIRASIKPKAKSQDGASTETIQPLMTCSDTTECKEDVVDVNVENECANKSAKVEAATTKSVTPALKLIEYSDSDEE